MAKIKLKGGISLTDNPEVNVPKFNFSSYDGSGRTVYHNNAEYIDFVTENGSLYVCLVDSVQPTGSIGSNSAFLKLVDRGPEGPKGKPGEDGVSAVEPRIGANFINDQLKVTVNDKTVAISPSLTGPTWKPVRDGNILTWELTDDRISPSDINLMDLRPIDKCPLLLRTNSDNTKRDDETSGPANFIQWKYEGDEHWTNLISISELMNLALCGICFWYDDNDQEWHFGNKEVLKATYHSDKNGRKIISRVELGDVLFDAGSIPINDYGVDIALINQRLDELENTAPDLDGYATEDWVNAQGFLKEVPEVDAYTKAQSDAIFQPKGTYVKSVNNHTPDSNGNVTITLGDFDLTSYVRKSDLATINGTVLYNGGNFDLGGGTTVIGLQDVEVSVNNGKLRYRKKENGTWGSYTNIMDVPTSTGDGDTVNGFVNVSLSGNVLTFTRQDGTTKSITLPNGSGQGCEYCWTEEQILGLINGALSNYYTKSQVYTKGEVDAMIGGSTNSYRTFMIFKRSASASSETLPSTTITWNVSQGELDIPSGSNGWAEHPANATVQTPYLWMASASFQSIDGERVGNWDGPFCLTGENGRDGEDGSGIEFAYILCTKAEYNAIKNTTPVAEHGDGRADDLPSSSTASGNTWTDHPSGISEEFPIEAVTIRKKTNGTWSAYSKPTIWSMWGEDGVDGDGVEYIFCVTAEPSIGAFAAEIPLTQPAVDALEESYQVDDWLPNNGNGNWTDNPLNVNESQPYEWVAIRKYRDGSGWGPFSEPRVWGLWGQKTITTTIVEDGTTYYKPYTCYAFTRTNDDLTGYSVEYTFNDYSQLTPEQKAAFYDNPLNFVRTLDANNYPVNNITWYDTVPNTSGQLWLITNHIGDEGDQSETGWNGPIKWGDNAGFQVEYAISDENTDAVFAGTKTLPSLNPYKDNSLETIDEASWRAATLAANCGTWSDSIENPVYMATAYKKGDGNWSSWTIAKVKGENGRDGINGTDGSDGKSIEFVYYRTKGAEPSIKEVNDVERGTYDPEDAAQRTETDKDLDRDDFFPAVSIATKTDGDYWHDHPSGVTEQLPYEWVATRTSAIQNGRRYWTSKFSVALWSKFGADGRDGDGIEYVFWGLSDADVQALNSTWPTQRAANAKNNGSNVQPERKDTPYNRSITDNEYLPAILINNTPLQAVDNNPGIEDNQYVYASMRRYNGASKEWGEFSEIKLWNEQSADNHNCVLHIENDSESVLVNNLNIIDDSFETFTVNIDDLWLRDNTTLLNIDQIAVNGVAFVNFSGQTITPVAGASTTIELDATHSLQITYSGAYVSPDRYNTKQIVLRLTFTEGSEIVAPIAIPISASSNGIVGTDLLTLFPVNVNELIKIGTTVTQDYHTSTRGSYDYDQSTVGITPSGLYQEPIKTVEKINYWVAFDQDKATAFTSGTSFFGPFSVPSAERPGAPGVNGTLEYDYYFKNDGTLQNSRDDETLIHIRMYHTGNEMRDTDQWNGYAEVYFGDYAVDPNNGFLPIDNIIVGVGYPNSSNTPIVTDREEYKIIYNGSTGPQGPQGPTGPQGPQGPSGNDGKTIISYQYLEGKVVRISEWSDTQLDFYDGTDLVDGVYYLDVVKYTSGNSTSYYKCKDSITYSGSKPASPASDSTHWEVYTPAADSWFDSLLANSAYIENLTSKQVVITDGNNIVAGMASGSDIAAASGNSTVGNVRIWAGTPTTNNDLTTAPFTVDNTGKLVSDNAEITGEIHAESGSIDGTLNIGSDGELVSSITTSDGTIQTVISATEIKNSYTDATQGYETRISNGQINVVNTYDGEGGARANLEPEDLQFYSQDENNKTSVYEAVTSPIIINDVYAGQTFAPIFHIVQVTALPADPSPGTLYVIVS